MTRAEDAPKTSRRRAEDAPEDAPEDVEQLAVVDGR
jgi:hypothetical protein